MFLGVPKYIRLQVTNLALTINRIRSTRPFIMEMHEKKKSCRVAPSDITDSSYSEKKRRVGLKTSVPEREPYRSRQRELDRAPLFSL